MNRLLRVTIVMAAVALICSLYQVFVREKELEEYDSSPVPERLDGRVPVEADGIAYFLVSRDDIRRLEDELASARRENEELKAEIERLKNLLAEYREKEAAASEEAARRLVWAEKQYEPLTLAYGDIYARLLPYLANLPFFAKESVGILPIAEEALNRSGICDLLPDPMIAGGGRMKELETEFRNIIGVALQEYDVETLNVDIEFPEITQPVKSSEESGDEGAEERETVIGGWMAIEIGRDGEEWKCCITARGTFNGEGFQYSYDLHLKEGEEGRYEILIDPPVVGEPGQTFTKEELASKLSAIKDFFDRVAPRLRTK